MSLFTPSQYDECMAALRCPNPDCISNHTKRQFVHARALDAHLASPHNWDCKEVALRMMNHGTAVRKRRHVADSNVVSHEQTRPPPGYRPLNVRQNPDLGLMMNTYAMNDGTSFPNADPNNDEANGDKEDSPMQTNNDPAPRQQDTIIIDDIFFVASTEEICIAELINLLDSMACPDYALSNI